VSQPLISSSPDPHALEPLDPAVKAKRKRVNRIVIAVVVMVAIPVLVTTLGRQWAAAVQANSLTGQTFNFNTPTTVHLNTPGQYVVWTYPSLVPCSVSDNGTPIASTLPTAGNNNNAANFYQSVGFVISSAGDYQVECQSVSATGYAQVSSAAPISSYVVIVLIGMLITVASFITGLVLFIVSLVKNHHETHPQPPPMVWVPAYGYGPPGYGPAGPVQSVPVVPPYSPVMPPAPAPGYPAAPGVPPSNPWPGFPSEQPYAPAPPHAPVAPAAWPPGPAGQSPAPPPVPPVPTNPSVTPPGATTGADGSPTRPTTPVWPGQN